MNIKARKGFSSGESNEIQRDWTERGWQIAIELGTYDRSRKHLNFEIKGGTIVPVDKSVSIPEAMAANLSARGIKDPNAGLDEPRYRTAVDFVFSGSHERMVEMAFGDQPVIIKGGDNEGNRQLKRMPEIEQWSLDIYNFLADKFGEENIINFTVHLDETSPHAHAVIVPVNEKGRISYKDVISGKDKLEFSRRMHELHDELAKVNAPYGLARGNSLAGEKKRSLSPKEYRYKMENSLIDTEYELAEAERELTEAKSALATAHTKVKALSKMVENIEQKKSVLEDELKELKRKQKNQVGDNEELDKQIREKQEALDEMNEALADKEKKLETAKDQLDEAKEKMSSLKQQNKALQDTSDKMNADVKRLTGSHIKAAMLDKVVSEYRQTVAKLPPEQRALFNDSFLEFIAEKGQQLTICAMYLFWGMLDSATSVAESGGGGGSTSNLRWDREEDENDAAWARRCMDMARQMMKPTSRSRKR